MLKFIFVTWIVMVPKDDCVRQWNSAAVAVNQRFYAMKITKPSLGFQVFRTTFPILPSDIVSPKLDKCFDAFYRQDRESVKLMKRKKEKKKEKK